MNFDPKYRNLVFTATNRIKKRDHFGTRLFSGLKYKGPFSMDYRERGSHIRGVYPTQYTSRIETARMKQEEEADTKNNKE